MLTIDWYADMPQEPPVALMAWLIHPGSFMRRLKAHGIAQAKVQIVHQGWQYPSRDERKCLLLGERRYAWVREVLIRSHERVWMFARTVIPASTLTGAEQRLKHLKGRALGSVLFKNPGVWRSDFDWVCLEAKHLAFKQLEHYVPLAADAVWGRRSQFYLHDKPLLLEEFFLPDLEKMIVSS